MKEVRTRYTIEYRNDLLRAFIKKFNQDKRPFKEKLKSIGIAKGTYSYLLNGEYLPQKQVMVRLKAYLEGKPNPLRDLDRATQFFCSSCELIYSKKFRSGSDHWSCKRCHNNARYVQRLRQWPKHLARVRERKLIKKYGQFATCMRLVLNVREEIRIYEKTKPEDSRRPPKLSLGRS